MSGMSRDYITINTSLNVQRRARQKDRVVEEKGEYYVSKQAATTTCRAIEKGRKD
jgi:hypothetical protein